MQSNAAFMNKYALAAATLAVCAASVWIASVYFTVNRYAVTEVGNGAFYKTDKQTGTTTVLYQGKELELEQYAAALAAPTPRQETEEERVAREQKERGELAVALAKEARTLDPTQLYTNEQFITNWLSQQKGDIQFSGWSAERVDDQIYLVTCAVVRDGKSQGARLEVNLAAQLVRNVRGDQVLEQKYSED